MERIIMGIDPGTVIMGYGVIRIVDGEINLTALGIIELHKFAHHYIRLKHIFDRTSQIIRSYLPDEIAIEAPFYGKNVQSMFKLGRAQGVVMAAALERDIPICEYAPRKIKQMITGQGNASKEQVATVLRRLFDVKETPVALDATDALATALCHHYASSNCALQQIEEQRNTIPKRVRGVSWNDFVRQNPDKVA